VYNREPQGPRNGFALAQQPRLNFIEERLALLLAHGPPRNGTAAVDEALDL
jgi:hypothetical protein